MCFSLLLVPSPLHFHSETQTPICTYPCFTAPWAASGLAAGPWSWFCCKFNSLRCRELIMHPRNYDGSMNRLVRIRLCVFVLTVANWNFVFYHTVVLELMLNYCSSSYISGQCLYVPACACTCYRGGICTGNSTLWWNGCSLCNLYWGEQWVYEVKAGVGWGGVLSSPSC